MIGRGLGHDAMTEIEDERPAPKRFENMGCLGAHFIPPRHKKQRIKIALHTAMSLQLIPRPEWRDACIKAQPVHAGFAEIARRRATCPARKSEHGNMREARLHFTTNGLRGLQRKPL